MERIKHKKYKYNTVSLFSGIGGFDLGFSNAGFNLIWANDFDKYACETFRANVSENIVCGDINEHLDEIPKHDILIGGFPCQPFSTLGKLKGFNDERGTLFFTIKQIITKHYPKVVVLENVKNIINHDNGKTFKRITNELEELGYTVYFKVHNTADFGIPQRRNRVYIVALKNGKFKNVPFEFPKTQKLKYTSQEFLDGDVEEKYFIRKK